MSGQNEGEPQGEAMDELPRKRFSGKKLILFIVLPLLLTVGAGAAIYFSGALDILFGTNAENQDEPPKEPPKDEKVELPVFYDLPPMLVNLSTTNRRPSFLKVSISLQLAKAEDTAAVEQVLPRIIDNFQIYLRELKPEDLKGSAGVYRLRQELLTRISAAAYPLKAKDVLFREILVQ